MDPLMPSLCILDTSVPQDRQQCVLKASKEARAAQLKPHQPTDDSGLRCLKTACDEAKRRCRLVTQNPSEVQWMGQLILTFGKYRGKSFHWLVENDVGYIKYIVDRHVKEKQRPERGPINDEWVKDYLLKYIQFFPHVSCHLEMCVDRAIYGQGRFKSFTFEEMWKWYSLHKQLLSDPQCGSDHERRMAQEAHTSVKQWLVMAENDIATSSLKRFRKYILDREVGRRDLVQQRGDIFTAIYVSFRRHNTVRPPLQRLPPPLLLPLPAAHRHVQSLPLGRMMPCLLRLLPHMKEKLQQKRPKDLENRAGQRLHTSPSDAPLHRRRQDRRLNHTSR